MNITVMGKLYGTLVLANRRALSAEANPTNLPLGPEAYREQAIAYMDYIAGKFESNG